MRPGNPSASLVVRPLGGDLTPDLFLSLRDRCFRDRHGLYLAEGLRALRCALGDRASIAGLAVCRELLHSSEARDIIRDLQTQGCPVVRLSRGNFLAISQAAEPQGVILLLRQNWQLLPEQVGRRDLWIGVENVRTPGNLGTLLRSAHAVGATGLMVFGPPRDRADPFDPACVRSSMGSLFAMRMVGTSHAKFRRWSHRYELRAFGADGGAAADYRRISYRNPTLLMLGEERRGLSEAQIATCDCLISIPMCPGPDSLNLAMAGTVLLYEAYNQRNPLGSDRGPGSRKRLIIT